MSRSPDKPETNASDTTIGAYGAAASSVNWDVPGLLADSKSLSTAKLQVGDSPFLLPQSDSLPKLIIDMYNRAFPEPKEAFKRVFRTLKPEGHPHTVANVKAGIFALDGVKVTVDNDGGGGNLERDHRHCDNTSWHFNGASLNPRTTAYFAVPFDLVKDAKHPHGSVELGTLVIVEHDGKMVPCVAGDVGNATRSKRGKGIGELSIHAARALGIASSPLSGGTEDQRTKVIFTNQKVIGISDRQLSAQMQNWLVKNA